MHLHFRLRPRNTSHACVFDCTPEGMAGVSAKSASWLCHSYGVEWPGWFKALFFQRGDSASRMKLRGTTPWGALSQNLIFCSCTSSMHCTLCTMPALLTTLNFYPRWCLTLDVQPRCNPFLHLHPQNTCVRVLLDSVQ